VLIALVSPLLTTHIQISLWCTGEGAGLWSCVGQSSDAHCHFLYAVMVKYVYLKSSFRGRKLAVLSTLLAMMVSESAVGK